MTEINKIKQGLAKSGKNAYVRSKSSSGAYVMRGNSIVRVTAGEPTVVVKHNVGQVRVKLKESDKVIVLK